MELEMTEGCVCYSYTVDDVEWVDLPIEKQREICHKIIDKTDNSADLQSIFEHYLYTYGKHEDLGTCEECGDSIDRYKAKL